MCHILGPLSVACRGSLPGQDLSPGRVESGPSSPTLLSAGQVARDIGRGRRAIMEVELSTPLTSFSARADIIAQGRQEAGDTSQVIVEIKTGPSSEFTVNQSYIYALAPVGGHLTSPDHRLPSVGLMPGTPLPKMDLLLLCTDGPGQAFRPYLLRAAEVDSADTLAAVMAAIRAFR